MSDATGAARYAGAAGEEYFAWQSGIGKLGGRLNRFKFERFVQPTDVVADFGCGGGFLLAGYDCARRIGIELNPAARAHAESLGIDAHADCSSVPADSVDLVISNHALEHVTAPLDELRRLLRIVKPGGRIVVVVPYEGWRKPDRYDPSDINQHLYAWTPLTLGNLAAAAGFEVQQVEVLWTAWTPGAWDRFGRIPWLYRLVCWWIAVSYPAPQLRVVASKR